MKRKKRILKICVAVLLVIVGAGIYLYPDYQTWKLERESKKILQTWKLNYEREDDTKNIESVEGSEKHDKQENDQRLQSLREEMKAYNQRLLEKGQELKDAWSYEQTPIKLEYLNADGIGAIEIPDMEVTLPLFLGASEENMAKGAAILAETSFPIGGPGTNCVIAGHRGYAGAPYFRDIENLDIGSLVIIYNPWEKLEYRVTAIDIIDPSDVDSILIQGQKDMVTLLTCHPYLSDGTFRYVVYCERDLKQGATEDRSILTEKKTESEKESGNSKTESESKIQKEREIRIIIPIVMVLVLIGSFIVSIMKSRYNKYKKEEEK